ncbi:hypothetical protein ACFX12_024137 [Malus domestica]
MAQATTGPNSSLSSSSFLLGPQCSPAEHTTPTPSSNHSLIPTARTPKSISSPSTSSASAASTTSSSGNSSLSNNYFSAASGSTPRFPMPSSTPVDHCLRQMPHQEIDLLKIVKRFLDPKPDCGLGLQLPLIDRLPDVLKNRLDRSRTPSIWQSGPTTTAPTTTAPTTRACTG